MKTTALTLCISLALTGCATTGANFQPLVDLRGTEPARYQADLAGCQSFARQQADAARMAVAGAVAGAIFGALLAAAAGGGYDRHASARVGALTGAARGGAQGVESQEMVIRRCLIGRGYSVLN